MPAAGAGATPRETTGASHTATWGRQVRGQGFAGSASFRRFSGRRRGLLGQRRGSGHGGCGRSRRGLKRRGWSRIHLEVIHRDADGEGEGAEDVGAVLAGRDEPALSVRLPVFVEDRKMPSIALRCFLDFNDDGLARPRKEGVVPCSRATTARRRAASSGQRAAPMPRAYVSLAEGVACAGVDRAMAPNTTAQARIHLPAMPSPNRDMAQDAAPLALAWKRLPWRVTRFARCHRIFRSELGLPR